MTNKKSKPEQAEQDAVVEASQRVEQAREALREAESHLEELTQPATEEPAFAPPTFEEFVQETLAWVRKYPAAGVAVSGIMGFLAGRWLRR